MKHINLIIALILMVSCGKTGGQIEKDNTLITGANKVIQYNNAFVDYFNESSNFVKSASKDYIKMFQMANAGEWIDFHGNVFQGPLPDASKEINGIILTEGTGLRQELIQQITPEINAANKAFKNSQSTYQLFNTYYKSEGFKKDQWLRGRELVTQLELSIKNFYKHRELSYFIIKPLADQAELVLLENHPLKEPIDATKGDLAIAEEMLLTLSRDVIDTDSINSSVYRLTKNVKEHESSFISLLKEHQKEGYYTQYYRDMNEFLGIINGSKDDGTFSINEINKIHQAYGKLVNAYNRFY